MGIKISKPNSDVLSTTENNLIFNSTYPALKVQSSGSGSVTLTGNQGMEVLVEHNLGYKPFFLVWIDYGSGYELVPLSYVDANSYFIGYYGTTDTTQLELVAIVEYVGEIDMWDEDWEYPPAPGDKTVDYAWVIFYDPIL